METPQAPPHRWPLFCPGALLFLLGPIGYVVQVSLARLEMMPWYLFGFAGVGLLLMFASALQRGGILRYLGLGLFVLLAMFEAFSFLVLTKSPDYKGPVHAGSKMPAFTTSLADGRPFTNADLQDGKPTVLIFFRGRW